ncbi:hypothetical protein K493DRAFT_411810 [Basidiobolus meristosporus CBS 931.73]|uniref:Uncharacterized protein n=1 Tax=Basidiobolus meristosporus CBS 931.73 TaxID=1314790 RepID=A0A1Y1XAI0_9FUNG|nr:hypothetical protein K493DRAFT_411810 [Basidiobolus meristosporus CBS 931.73]|eukprot:ORX82446.1 hypothetical protein K493DRAFT_411810 [Basidiobolus meristosporus CBS 931.73]
MLNTANDEVTQLERRVETLEILLRQTQRNVINLKTELARERTLRKELEGKLEQCQCADRRDPEEPMAVETATSLEPTGVEGAQELVPINPKKAKKKTALQAGAIDKQEFYEQLPFVYPTGIHITKFLLIFHDKLLKTRYQPLMKLVLHKTKITAKEITETIGVFIGLQKLQSQLQINFWLKKVCLWVPGDGKIPFTAGVFCLKTPDIWKIYSIDPRMKPVKPQQLGLDISERLICVQACSQDFEIPSEELAEGKYDYHIVLGVHSHAPLQEFWDRLTVKEKYCLSVPCCADYGFLSHPPIFQYDDFEIFSDKRRVIAWGPESSA